MITIKPNQSDVKESYEALVRSKNDIIMSNFFYLSSDFIRVPGKRMQAIKLKISPDGNNYVGEMHLVALPNEINRREIPYFLEELVSQRQESLREIDGDIHIFNDYRELAEFNLRICPDIKNQDLPDIVIQNRPDFILRKNNDMSRKLKGLIYTIEFGQAPTNTRKIASAEQFQAEITAIKDITENILNMVNSPLECPYHNPVIKLDIKPQRI